MGAPAAAAATGAIAAGNTIRYVSTAVMPVAENDDDGVIVDAAVIWGVGLHGDGVIGALTR